MLVGWAVVGWGIGEDLEEPERDGCGSGCSDRGWKIGGIRRGISVRLSRGSMFSRGKLTVRNFAPHPRNIVSTLLIVALGVESRGEIC
jgi:hypothetical protein